MEFILVQNPLIILFIIYKKGTLQKGCDGSEEIESIYPACFHIRTITSTLWAGPGLPLLPPIPYVHAPKDCLTAFGKNHQGYHRCRLPDTALKSIVEELPQAQGNGYAVGVLKDFGNTPLHLFDIARHDCQVGSLGSALRSEMKQCGAHLLLSLAFWSPLFPTPQLFASHFPTFEPFVKNVVQFQLHLHCSNCNNTILTIGSELSLSCKMSEVTSK